MGTTERLIEESLRDQIRETLKNKEEEKDYEDFMEDQGIQIIELK